MTVYEAADLPGGNGGVVSLRLLVTHSGRLMRVHIDRTERLRHKTLKSTVLDVEGATAHVGRVALDATTIAFELERLHRQGYSLRERAGGGLRGTWRADLMPPRGPRPVVSWEIKPRRPDRKLQSLSRALASLDVPVPRADAPSAEADVLVASMREHGREVRRRHIIDVLTAADSSAPSDEWLRELDTQGLLGPTEHDEDSPLSP